MKRWKISHKFVFSFCSDPTSISVSVWNLRKRERGGKSFCLCTWDTEEEGEEDWRMEGWKQDTSSGLESVFQEKSLAFGVPVSICSATALALLRGVFYTFVCYTEAAQKKPNFILPFSHPAWVDRGQLDGSWALRQGGFLVRALNQIPESLKRFLKLSGTCNFLF